MSLKDISSEEFSEVIDKAIYFKNNPHKTALVLKNKYLGLLFEKSSTRTIVSFKVAILSLGGYPIVLSSKDSQLSRGEKIKETAMVLNGYLDGIIVRTYADEKLEELSSIVDFPVINALSKAYHPCQALADVMTFQEEGFDLKNMKVCFAGDGNSNVAHSLIMSAMHAKFRIVISSPKEYQPQQDIVQYAEEHGAEVRLVEDLHEAIEGVDVVYTDVWTSMGKESESNERKKALQNYQIDESILNEAKPDTIVMHCMPIHFGEEITSGVFHSAQSRIIKQAHNRLHTAKALLYHLYK